MKQLASMLLAGFILFSCETQEGINDVQSLLIGNWSHATLSDTTQVLKRVTTLPDDEYGITFLEKRKVIEWKNVGFCGTPPITYGEHEGSWELSADSIISMEVDFWGGEMLTEMKIIDINEEHLSYLVIKSDANFIE